MGVPMGDSSWKPFKLEAGAATVGGFGASAGKKERGGRYRLLAVTEC
jgi:hypothetical protein